jgi:hypothetical protein
MITYLEPPFVIIQTDNIAPKIGGKSEYGNKFSCRDMDILQPICRDHGHSVGPRASMQAEV